MKDHHPWKNWLEIHEMLELYTYDDTCIEMISKKFKENQKVRCLIVVNQVIWKWIICKEFLGIFFFSRGNTNGIPHPSGKCRTCGKGLNWTNECWSIWDREGNPLPLENSVRGLSQVPLSNLVQSIPVTIGKILHRLIKRLNALTICGKPYSSGR